MSESTKPCVACLEQIKKERHAKPHSALRVFKVTSFRELMSGGWEETIYKCCDCFSIITTTNDKNEFFPFWWFTRESD